MWEDFMRGNWPAPAPAPAPAAAPQAHDLVADTSGPRERHHSAEIRAAEPRSAQTRFVKVASSDAVPGDGVVAGRRRIAARVAIVAGAALPVAGPLPAAIAPNQRGQRVMAEQVLAALS